MPTLHRRTLLLALTLPLPALASAPTYTLRPIGTPSFESSTPIFLTPTGRSAGTSSSYNSLTGTLNQVTWVDDGTSTHPAGLTGPDYTNSSNQFFSDLLSLNDAGFALGYSLSYTKPATRGQRTPWLFDPSTNTSTPLGYSGPGFTSPTNTRSSTAKFLDAAGRVFGTSVRFDSVGSAGTIAWVYRPADQSLTPIGYDGTPGPYTPPALHTFSTTLVAANPAGQIIGSTPTGASPSVHVYAWLYDANSNTTTPLGLTDADHTSPDGAQSSTPSLLNNAGFVAGTSFRYTPSGRSAWLYDPTTSTTSRIGLSDPAHTEPNGSQYSSPLLINPAGQVAGTSQQTTPANQFPNAWIYDGHNTIPLGLTDPAHTTPDGGHYSTPTHLDAHGRVAGYSYLYQPDIGTTTVPSGQTAWLYTPGAGTQTLGLTGPGFVTPDNRSSSQITVLSDAGPIAGTSEHISTGSPSDYNGDTPWIYDPTTHSTTPVGLAGGIYTNHNLQLAHLTSLNDAGQAIGYSQQITPDGGIAGQSAWFYDPLSHSTLPLTFSTRPDGTSYSTADLLATDGTVFGIYRLYASANPNDYTSHAYRWSLPDGLTDLGSLLSNPNPFASLDSLPLTNPQNQIAGFGTIATDTSLSFLLTPTTPEPSSALACGLAITTLLPRRQTKRISPPSPSPGTPGEGRGGGSAHLTHL